MAEKILATRIQSKYDLYANWEAQNPVLKSGEIGICVIPVSTPASGADQTSKPAVLIKVGDGTKNWKDLPWLTGLAGDVYSWAKAENKPTYSATEITGLEDFIAGEIQDTDTQYNLEFDSATGTLKFQSKTKSATAWTDVDSFVFAEGATNGTFKITDSKGASKEIAIHGLGTAAYQNTDAFVAPGDLDAYMPLAGGQFTGDVSFAEGKKLTLAQAPAANLEAANKKYVDDAKSSAIETAAADATTKANAAETNAKNYTDEKTAGLTGAMHFKGTVDAWPPTGNYVAGDVVLYGNKEYVYDPKKTGENKWIELGDEGSYALKTTTINNKPLSGNITLTASDVGAATAADIATEIGKLDAALVGGNGKYIKSVEQVDGVITAVEGTMPTALKNPNALTFTGGSTEVYDGSKAVSVAIPVIPAALPNPHTLTFTGAVTGTYDGSADKTAHIPTIAEMTADLSNDDAAVANQFVTVVKQTNGVVAVNRAQPTADDISGLALIAKTGNVKDLVQTEGDILVFDCGSATVNI